MTRILVFLNQDLPLFTYTSFIYFFAYIINNTNYKLIIKIIININF